MQKAGLFRKMMPLAICCIAGISLSAAKINSLGRWSDGIDSTDCQRSCSQI